MDTNNSNNNIDNELYKSNRDFADELRRCWMILDIYFCDNIYEKIIVNKSIFDDKNNNKKDQSENFADPNSKDKDMNK